MGLFIITDDTPAVIGIVKANLQYGNGGTTQIVIPDFDNVTANITILRLQLI